MNTVKRLSRKVAMGIAKTKSMQEITQLIFSHSIIDENGKLWSPSGKCIGWYNSEWGVGWCNLKGYKELKNLAQTPKFEGEDLYDEVDLEEYLALDYDAE